MSEREQFEAWWKTTGRALCGCSLVPDHTSPNQVFAARGFGAGFAAGFEAARAQPAQAGQVLTDVELAALMPPPDIDGSKARSPNAVRLAMRAVEAAVLAKRVPMTRQQIDAMSEEVQRRANQLSEEGRYTFGGWFPIAVELIEAHHGIVGEKGGA